MVFIYMYYIDLKRSIKNQCLQRNWNYFYILTGIKGFFLSFRLEPYDDGDDDEEE